MNDTTDIDRAMLLGAGFLTELKRALLHHIWLILAVAVGVLLVTYGALQFVSDQYESTARLLVKLGRENTEVPVAVEKGTVLSTGVRKEEINSEIQLLTSRTLIEATVDRVGLPAFKMEPPPPQTWFQHVKHELRTLARWFKAQWKEALITLGLRKRLGEREEAILLVQKTMAVEREKDSDVISVSIRLPSADLSMRVVDAMVHLFLDKHVEVRRDRDMSSFFDEQLQALKGQLDELDNVRQRVRDQRGISAMSDERSLLLQRLQVLRTELADADRELRLLVAGDRYTLKPVAFGPSPAASSPLTSYPNLEHLRDKSTELRIKRSEQLYRFTPDSEPVMQTEREIGQIESTLRQALSAQSQEKRLLAASLEARLRDLNAGETALDENERDRQVAAQNYLTYAKRREEARIAEELDARRVSNIAVINGAERPIDPVGPKRVLLVGLALPFGLMVGLGLALLLEYANQRIRDEHDLEGLEGIRFLGPLRLPADRKEPQA